MDATPKKTGNKTTYSFQPATLFKPVSKHQVKLTYADFATNIGQDGTGAYGSVFTDMDMDDLGIWRRVVTPQEVAAIYAAGQAGKDLSTVVLGSGDAGELACAVSGGALTISWTEPGTVLQQSSDLKAWADVAGAASPYSPTVAGTPAMFYRLKK